MSPSIILVLYYILIKNTRLESQGMVKVIEGNKKIQNKMSAKLSPLSRPRHRLHLVTLFQ